MRKVLFVACAVGLLATAFAVSASATESAWTIFIAAGSGGTAADIQGQGSEAWVATRTTAGVTDDPATKDGVDGTVVPPAVAPVAFAQWYRPWNADGSFGFFTRDAKQPLNTIPNLIKRWDDLIVWATGGSGVYSSPDIKLFISGSGVPNTVGGVPVAYKLIMTQSPDGYGGQTEWVLPEFPAPDTTAKTAWFEITLPSTGAVTANPISGTGALSATQSAGYRFSLVTPEPGSIMVLASGLAGLVGLVSRRRSA